MRIKSFRIVSLALAMVLASVIGFPAFGQESAHSINISRQAKWGGQMLSPGKYRVAFDEKSEGEAVIFKGKEEVLRASYKFMELGKSASDSAVVFAAADDGSLQVRRIEIKGMKMALLFE